MLCSGASQVVVKVREAYVDHHSQSSDLNWQPLSQKPAFLQVFGVIVESSHFTPRCHVIVHAIVASKVGQ